MKKYVLTLFSILTWTAIINGQNPTPFTCSPSSDGFGYYSSSATSTLSNNILTYSSSRISKITTSSGNRVTLCESAAVGVSLNGLAFNPHDNFLYGFSRYDVNQFSGTLYRIGENCQKAIIPVSGPIIKYSTNNITTIDAAGGNISSATFDLDNHLYVNTSFTNAASSGFTNKLQKILISNNNATVLGTVTLTCPSCTGTNKLRVTDIIFDETTGKLYGSNKETNRLYSINTNTGILTSIGSTSITSPILGIYKNKDGNIRAISETGNIYNVNINTGLFTFLSTSTTLNSANADAASGCYAPPNITGNLFVDANGLSDNIVNGTGTDNAGGSLLFANLIQNNIVVKSSVLTPGGFYQFLGLFSGTYEVQISITKGTIGQAPPAQNLPNTFMWVGDNIGTNTGNDGSANGKLTVIISMGLDVENVNFGIDGIPMASDLSVPSQSNPSLTNQVQVPMLVISDPEEININNITILSIPNQSTQGILYYNGIAVAIGQQISSYNPSLLTVDPIDGNVTVIFTYITTDMAGLISNTATVTMPFTAEELPVELLYFTGIYSQGANHLNWSTASEINSAYFTVERKSNEGDFEQIGLVKAKGISSQKVIYQFIDKDIIDEAYYRLIQTDVDGAFEIFKTIFIKAEVKNEFSIFPTITSQSINVTIDVKYDDPIVYNIHGSLVSKGLITSEEGFFDVNELSAGTYFFQLMTDIHRFAPKKFIKL